LFTHAKQARHSRSAFLLGLSKVTSQSRKQTHRGQLQMKPWMKRNKVGAGLAIAGFWLGIIGIALALSGEFPRLQSFPDVAQAVAALVTPTPVTGGTQPAIAMNERAEDEHGHDDDPMTTRDATGLLRTINHAGAIDRNNAFFQSIGTNGRSCGSCHVQSAAWSITPPELQARFEATGGNDPIFRRNDGANSPNVDVSTVAARRNAYSMLLRRAVIRVGIGIPASAEFTLADVQDPYGFASTTELSLFRRVLPSTNLAFLTGVMWDGRETVTPFLPPMHAGQNNTALQTALIQQATHATLGHAQAATPPSSEQLAQIVSFETALTTAQIRDDAADFLNDDDAIGGPRVLTAQRFHVGLNDTLGADPTGAIFDPESMALFTAWSQTDNNSQRSRARASVARGEALFNHLPINITGVGGLNDALGVPSIPGTCTTCHNSPNVGNHSVALPLNIGLTDASRRTPDMPLYTLRNKTTGVTVQTTDPGLALITGKWKDIGRFKGPILRGLAARPPYFHNGFAASLPDVVDFYDTRFAIHMDEHQKRDMVAFLRSL
jgi:cytochrome c peroxidase